MHTILTTAGPAGRLADDSRSGSASSAHLERTWFDLMMAWIERGGQRRRLEALDDHMLKDIGLARADVVRECAKPFWRE